jgi:hypothetical protein
VTRGRPGQKKAGGVSPVVLEREYRMIDMLVKGASMSEIGDAFEVSRGVAARTVRDALLRRAKFQESVTSQVAKALVLDRLEHLISRVMPLADGSLTGVPDLKAVTELVNMLKLAAQIQNVIGSKQSTDPGVTINQTVIAVEQTRDEIMRSLDQVADRAEIIQGTLA